MMVYHKMKIYIYHVTKRQNTAEDHPQRALTLWPSRVYSFLMWHCMSSDTSSIKTQSLCTGFRCSRMVFWMDRLLFFTSTILLRCLCVWCWWWWLRWWCGTPYTGSPSGRMGLLGVCWWLGLWGWYHEAGRFPETSEVTGLPCWDSEHREHLRFSSCSKCVEVQVLLWDDAVELCPAIKDGFSTMASKHWKLCLWDVILSKKAAISQVSWDGEQEIHIRKLQTILLREAWC